MTKTKLPSWTWWLPFLIILSSKIISQFTFQRAGVHYIYLPHLIGSALFFWWGPRIIPAYFLAEMLTASLSGTSMWVLTPLFAVISTTKAFMGYFLFVAFTRNEPRTAYVQFFTFFFWVILLPNIICNYLIFAQFVAVGRYGHDEFIPTYLFVNLVDWMGGVLVTYPLVEKVSPWLKARGLSQWPLN
ncbi:hypothetical protein [Bdellovibrio sp. HCB2-146]|uniref:hypothetical protein n=1 Tax=Bdellovibrio sp. HCB2-146 TaxID=3394362 RepID=UPI0039BCD4AD